MPPLAVSLPAYCRLNATLDRRTGADGRSYGIGFALALPAEWNGRFLFQGGGGLNGTVAPPLGRTGRGDAALARGFAVVTTDTGHRGEVFDASFMAEQQASLDFAYQAVGRVAVLAKQILAQHYGKPAAHAYFMGCSTGGREGMLMAQRYPTYFDGIVAGAPAMRTHYSGIGDQWVATMLNRVAPLDDSGKPDGRRAFSEADRKAVIDGLLARLRWRRRPCATASSPIRSGAAFDPVSLRCPGAKTDGCLSAPQADALAKAFAGPKDSKGPAGVPGLSLRHGHRRNAGHSGTARRKHESRSGPPFTATEMNVDERAESAAADPQMQLTATSSWTNLNTLLEPRREAALLPWRQRPVVLGPRHGRLLRADDAGERRRVRRHRLEPALPGAGHGPLWRRPGDARHLRRAPRDRRLGGEGERAAGHSGRRPKLARTQPPALPLPVARALQGDGRHRRRRLIRVPLVLLARTSSFHLAVGVGDCLGLRANGRARDMNASIVVATRTCILESSSRSSENPMGLPTRRAATDEASFH